MAEVQKYVLDDAQVELRTGDKGKPEITGYAAVFDSLSHDLGGFVEIIRKGAFDEALRENPDVSAKVQHAGGMTTIGRTTNGSLRIWVDAKGLAYAIKPPNTQVGRDIVELVREGYINKSSFAFSLRPRGEKWNLKTSPPTRELLNLNIHDVSPVDGPAYEATTVEARAQGAASLEAARAAVETAVVPVEDRAAKFRGETRAEMTEMEDGKKVCEVFILDVIEDPFMASIFGGVSGKAIMEQMCMAKDADMIDVYINSPGGSVFEGMTIHNALRQFKKPVNVYVQGLAASAASVVAMAGDKIMMGRGSRMMVHNSATGIFGNAKDLRQQANLLDKIDIDIAGIYARRAKTSYPTVKAWMDKETWFSAYEAVANGLADEAVDPIDEAVDESRKFDFEKLNYRNIPTDWKEEARIDAAKAQEAVPESEMRRLYERVAALKARKDGAHGAPAAS